MATIKISELSVGDWVVWNGRRFLISTTFSAVVGLPPGVALLSKNELLGIVPVSKLSPIPITPKILEANGWEKVSEVVYKWNDEKHSVFVWLNEFSHIIDVEEMDEQSVAPSSRIEVSQLYVHQLQHALRLAGVDKEIIMPNT